jgi:hypothetical protein
MSTPLRILVDDLLHDSAARASFAADPEGYLGEHGWAELDGADVGTALTVLRQELPIDEAARLGGLDADTFGDGPAGAISGLQAAAAAFDIDWSDDPATTLDELTPSAEDDLEELEDASGTFEFPLSEDSNVPEAESGQPDDSEVDGEVDADTYELEDPLGDLGEPDPFADADLDMDGWSEIDIDEGLDDG